MADQPHERHPHLWVVVRVDDWHERHEDAISLVSAFRSRPDAEAEAARLRALRPASGSRYVVVITRLKG